MDVADDLVAEYGTHTPQMMPRSQQLHSHTPCFCSSMADYVAKAVALASNIDRLRALQDKVRQNRVESALFDTHRWVLNWQALLSEIVQDYR